MRPGGRMRGRGRGRGRGQPARHTEPIKAKPYVSHEIQSIDMELQLLRKKREMIEQQKNILKNQIKYSKQKLYDDENPRYHKQNSYDSPGSSRSNRDFVRYYDDPVGEEDYIPLSSSRKRPADESWSWGSGAKRHGSRGGGGGGGGGVVQSFGSRLGPKPVPQSQTRVPQPGPSRKQLVDSRKLVKSDSVPPATLPRTVLKNKSAYKDPEDYTLRAGYEPSTVLNGLFELGVGFILKQMKQMYGNSQKYSRVVTREYYTRRLKKAVRSRIRKLMVNKYVDNYVDVVDQYRKKFPLKTDEELVAAASSGEVWEPPTGHEPRNTDPSTEAPRAGMPCPNFFKSRMRRYVGGKLRRMFKEIYHMYYREGAKASAVDSSGDVIMAEDNEKPGKVVPSKAQPKNPKWKINIASIINEKLCSVMQSYIPTITTILNMDPAYNRTKASLLATTLNMDPTVIGEVVFGDLEEPEVVEIHEESKPIRYYAKVCGRPNMPQRDLMRPFLDKFKPKSIKTHKKSKNLLFVMFMDKDSYDKFLSQDGVSVGNSTLDIKISGKVNPIQVPNNEENENIDTGADNQASIDSKEKGVTPTQMENQIIDLLSSITKGEKEQASVNEENESVSEDKTEKENKNESQIESVDKESTEILNECGEQNHEGNKLNDEQNDQTVKNDNSELSDNNLKTSHTDSAVEENAGVIDDATKVLCTVNEETQKNETQDKEINHENATDEKIHNENETT